MKRIKLDYSKNDNRFTSLFLVQRYGPQDDISMNNNEELSEEECQEFKKQEEDKMEKRRTGFNALVKKIINAKSDVELPSIMTNNIDLLLNNVAGFEGVDILKSILKEAELSDDEGYKNSVALACDYILEFTSEFVEQAKEMDDSNKKLLGQFLKIMTGKGTDREKEKKLDEMVLQEKKNFSPGFLNHMERECIRIESAPQITPESTKLIQTLKTIQLRIIGELGKDLGEGAIVLNQLIGYETKEERLAVLEAGLVTRGLKFARNLYELTEEAKQGFQKYKNVDPDLKIRVDEINHAIQLFIESRSSYE